MMGFLHDGYNSDMAGILAIPAVSDAAALTLHTSPPNYSEQ
jgi:hypothetical protein